MKLSTLIAKVEDKAVVLGRKTKVAVSSANSALTARLHAARLELKAQSLADAAAQVTEAARPADGINSIVQEQRRLEQAVIIGRAAQLLEERREAQRRKEYAEKVMRGEVPLP